jgi:hypothetical protein
MSSPAQTLGSWVRIPLEVWMSVCVSSVLVLSCICSGLATGWSPVQGVLPTVYKIQSSRLILVGNRPEYLIRLGWRRVTMYIIRSYELYLFRETVPEEIVVIHVVAAKNVNCYDTIPSPFAELRHSWKNPQSIQSFMKRVVRQRGDRKQWSRQT